MGTDIVEFQKTPGGRGSSPTWFSSCLRTLLMVDVFEVKMVVYFRPRDWDKSWKFWTISDSPGWVWYLPSGGPDCVFVMIWIVPS